MSGKRLTDRAAIQNGKRLTIFAAAAMLAATLCACGGPSGGKDGATATNGMTLEPSQTLAAEAADASGDTTGTGGAKDGSEIATLGGLTLTAAPGAIQISGSVATLTEPGTYTLSGVLEDGQIIVDATETVTLILDNADITCKTSAPLYIKAADKVVLTLPENTKNRLTDGGTYAAGADAEPDAALFSKADLEIEGTGALSVNATGDGIASRDTLTLRGGNLAVNAANHGIKGKDYLLIQGGEIAVKAGGDGLKATNAEQSELGYVKIVGGDIDIDAQDEGISAVTLARMEGGNLSIHTQNNAIKSEDRIELQAGTIAIQTADDALVCKTQAVSKDVQMTINGRSVAP